MKIVRLSVPVLALLSACATDAPLDPPAEGADLVVQGVVSDVQSRWQRGTIMSRARVAVDQTLAGNAAATIDVEFAGGVVDGIGQLVPDGLTLARGEEVVLFLRRAGGLHVAMRGAADKFTVTRPPVGEPIATSGDGATELLLGDLTSSVRAAPAVAPPKAHPEFTRYVQYYSGCAADGALVPLRWPTHHLAYLVDVEEPDGFGDAARRGALRAGAQAWHDAACSDLELEYLGPSIGLEPGYQPDGPNENLVAWITTDEEWPPQFGDPLALNTLTYFCASGEVLDSDIRFNARVNSFSADPQAGDASYDIQGISSHEFGHGIGFDHSPDEESTMFATIGLADTSKRSLTQGDVFGVCDVYIPGAGQIGSDPRPDRRNRGPIPKPDVCGDGRCEGDESSFTCPEDCGAIVCGDGECTAFENCATCAADCGACVCSDGTCSPGECACEADCGPDACFCSDDVCSQSPPQDPSCGACQSAVCAAFPGCCLFGWFDTCIQAAGDLCGADCPPAGFCGDGLCSPPEDPLVCPADCQPPPPPPGVCGDLCVESPPHRADCGPCDADVCALDPFCCEVAWDAVCIAEAQDVCGTDCAP